MVKKNANNNGISGELQSYIREIKGTRTVREFSKDTGVSTATLSKYMTGNGKGDVKIETLRRIISEDAKPQGDVTFYDLMRAAGFDIKDDYHEDVVLGNIEVADNRDNSYEGLSSGSLRRAYYDRKKQLESMVKAKIFDSVIKSNGEYTIDTSEFEKAWQERNGNYYDVFLRVKNDTKIWHWYITFKFQASKHADDYVIYNEIGKIALKNFFTHDKWSIIVNNKETFDKLVKIAEPQRTAILADISLIYYNEKEDILEEEAYLSVCGEDSTLFSIIDL